MNPQQTPKGERTGEINQSGGTLANRPGAFGTTLDNVKSTAVEETKETANQLKEEAVEVLHSAKAAGSDFACEQKEKIATSLDDYRLAMEAACGKLEEEGNDALAGRARRITARLGSASSYLRDKDPTAVFHDLEAFARRKPEVVIGAFFIAGLAAVRFLKASSHRDRSHHSDTPRAAYVWNEAASRPPVVSPPALSTLPA